MEMGYRKPVVGEAIMVIRDDRVPAYSTTVAKVGREYFYSAGGDKFSLATWTGEYSYRAMTPEGYAARGARETARKALGDLGIETWRCKLDPRDVLAAVEKLSPRDEP